MDTVDVFALLSRWAHILAVITLVGGTLFVRLALVPATGDSSADSDLREAVRSRWVKYVMLSIVFLLISGFYNAYLKAIGFHLDGIYLGLLTIKIVAGIAIFFLVSRLTGRSEKAQAFRQQETRWLDIICSLMLILVLIAGYMKLSVYEAKLPNATGDETPTEIVN